MKKRLILIIFLALLLGVRPGLLDALWPQFLGLAILGGIVFPAAVNRFRKRLD